MISFEGLYPRIGDTPARSAGAPKRVRAPLDRPHRGAKNTAAYNAHSYPTKVPPEAIEPFIEHHTKRGALILDPFCGSGMAGLAARRLGRGAILNDLSYGAAHLAWNIATQCDPEALGRAAAAVLAAVEEPYSRWYGTTARDGSRARLAWTLHSLSVACATCGRSSSLWKDATDRERGTVAGAWRCGSCGAEIRRRSATRVGSFPVWVAVDEGGGRFERAPSREDRACGAAAGEEPIGDWYPRVALRADREMYVRCALQLSGIEEVADFWTPRNLRALARLWAEIAAWPQERERQALAFAFTNTAWHATRMRRYNARGGQRPLTGTLYIPQLSIEVNPALVFAHKIRQLQRFYAQAPRSGPPAWVVRASATALPLEEESVDYVFTDPPFGSNIFYGDCAVVWESWLGRTTPVAEEAVVNRSLKAAAGGKGIEEYASLMGAAFAEVERVLKPDAWATVVFQSSDDEVWSALRLAVERAGFDLASASYLDKTQQSHKGYKGRSGSENVASFDVVLNLHKPGGRQRRPKPPGGFADAGELLARHLAELPPVGEDPGADRRRTLPFLHSLLVQAHFNGGLGLEVGRYALVRRLCEERFEVDGEGRWRLRGGAGEGPSRARGIAAAHVRGATSPAPARGAKLPARVPRAR
jgi:DNA modification methylase